MSLTTYESPGMNIAYGRIGTIKDYCIILKQSWLLPLARWMEREWWHCLCVCLLYFKCTLSNQTKLHASFGIFCLIIRQSLLLIICTFFYLKTFWISKSQSEVKPNFNFSTILDIMLWTDDWHMSKATNFYLAALSSPYMAVSVSKFSVSTRNWFFFAIYVGLVPNWYLEFVIF